MKDTAKDVMTIDLYEFINEAIFLSENHDDCSIAKALNEIVQEHICKVLDNAKDFEFTTDEENVHVFYYYNSDKKYSRISKDAKERLLTFNTKKNYEIERAKIQVPFNLDEVNIIREVKTFDELSRACSVFYSRRH